jgi:hypothetical protein
MTEQTHLRTVIHQDGAAILDTKLGIISTLNATGAYVWEALQRGESAPAIARQLAADTGEPFDRVEAEVDAFLDALKEQYLFPAATETNL